MHVMFCSAMPTSMKRAGKRLAKKLTMGDSLRSPTITTMRGSRSPSSTSARPKPSRVFFISTFAGREMVAAMGSAFHEALGPLGVRRAEFPQRHFGLFHLGRLAVPAEIVGHVRHALAHDGVGQDDGRLARVLARPAQRLE